jgi:hypothetical protein
MTGAQHSSIIVVITCNMICCSHRGSILWTSWVARAFARLDFWFIVTYIFMFIFSPRYLISQTNIFTMCCYNIFWFYFYSWYLTHNEISIDAISQLLDVNWIDWSRNYKSWLNTIPCVNLLPISYKLKTNASPYIGFHTDLYFFPLWPLLIPQRIYSAFGYSAISR